MVTKNIEKAVKVVGVFGLTAIATIIVVGSDLKGKIIDKRNKKNIVKLVEEEDFK